MLKGLPTLIEPKLLALEGCRLKGKVALAQMTRLCENLDEEVQGEAEIDWLFVADEKGRPTIRGHLQAQLPVQCQRCLQPMRWFCDMEIALIVLTDVPIQDEEIPVGYETITLTSTQLSLVTLIEDELILALPIVAKHNECPSNEYQLQESPIDTFQNTPFQVLSKLKKMVND